jgi:hypothetical protein
MQSADAEVGKKIGKDCGLEFFSNGSVKGNWSEYDKQNFRKALGMEKDVMKLGEYKTEWIECCLSKIEGNYSSYYEALLDLDGSKKFALECNEVILSTLSVKGKWSESDKQKFYDEIEREHVSSKSYKIKKEIIECLLSKCEAKYSSFYEANADEKGCTKLGLECKKEFK